MTRVLEVAGRAEGGLAGQVRSLVEGLPSQGFELAQAEVAGATVDAAFMLWRLIRRWRPAVLHLHGFRAGLVGRLAAALIPGPRPGVVYTVHGEPGPAAPPLARAGLAWAERALFPVADRVLAVSGSVRGYLVRLGLPPGGVEVLPGGVDAERFRPGAGGGALRQELGVLPGQVLVGSAGRLAPEKGMEDYIRAVADLAPRRPDARFLLAGDGPLRPRLVALAQGLGLAGRLHFLGRREDMPAVLSDLDLFLLPSRSEGLPQVLLEAMACGVPVVAAWAGGVAEALAPGTGVLVPPGTPGALSAAAGALLDDPDRRRRLGRLARAVVKHRFERRQWLGRMAAIYREVGRG
ncbi:MAG: glycosyltransferase [Acetobacteraceae bacterium]|nr:glycosyltransferase [Acetobacteraceae bacterium]